MIYSAQSKSHLAKSHLAKSHLAKSRSAKPRSVSDKSLPEQPLSQPLAKPLAQPLLGRSFTIGRDGPARLEGASLCEETEAPLPDRLMDTLDLEQGDNLDLEQVDKLHMQQYDHELAAHIVSRIESRLPGRILHLTVFTTENAVILSGECSTFYTKQVAQHAAMGVLEYEQLINNIDVRTA